MCVGVGGSEAATGDRGLGGSAVGVVRGSQLQTYAGWQRVERWIAVGHCQRGSFITISAALFTWYF